MGESVYLEKLTEFSFLLRQAGLTVGLQETADDCAILEALGMEEGSSPEPEKPPAPPPLSGDSAAVHRALGSEALTPDELAARTGLSIGAVLACLTEMELDGVVASLPGGKYERLV